MLSNLAEKNVEMPGFVKSKMEQSMGYDFSKVQMKESERASQMGANAYAKGNVITFAPGKFNPMSVKGQELIGHELGHIVQNTRHTIQSDVSVGNEEVNLSNSYESEADHMGEEAAHASSEMSSNDLAVADAGGSEVVQGSFLGDLWSGVKSAGAGALKDAKGLISGGGGGVSGLLDNNLVSLGLNAKGAYSGIKDAFAGFKKDEKTGKRDWLKGIGGILSAGSGILGGIMNVRDMKNAGAAKADSASA